MCPWDVATDSGADKKRSLPTSIAEERDRRLSTSSSRKNSGSGPTYDSASADESQSDSVASRLRRSCGLGGSSGERRRGSSATCTPQQTVDRPSVSSAEDFDLGTSPESRSPEKPQPTSPHSEQSPTTATAISSSSSLSLDAKSNRKKLLKTLSLARKQSVTPVINVSSVDRDSDRRLVEETATDPDEVEYVDATTVAVSAPTVAVGRQPETASVAGTAAASEAPNATDDNDVCPWEDE